VGKVVIKVPRIIFYSLDICTIVVYTCKSSLDYYKLKMALVVGVDCQAKLIRIKSDAKNQDACVYIIVCYKSCRSKKLKMSQNLLHIKICTLYFLYFVTLGCSSNL
jgi:hypothetical protein